MVCARVCSKIGVSLSSPCQVIREAFVNWRRIGVMEQASGSTLTGLRAFSAQLPFTPLLRLSTALRVLVYYSLSGEYLWLVLLDYVDIFDVCVGDPLFPFVPILNPQKPIYICTPLPLAVLSLTPAVTKKCKI